MCTAIFKKIEDNKINRFHDVLVLFCRIYGCSAVHNSPLEMFSTTKLLPCITFIRNRHPFISVHFQSFYITWTFSTKRQVCIYRKIRPSKHQITEQSPKLVLSDLSIFKKEEKKSLQLTSLPELIWLDVKLRTSPVLEMVRKWVWGTALRERQYGMLPRALLKHVPACYAKLQPIFTVSVVAQLFEELCGCLERGSEIPCRGTLPHQSQ